MIKRTKKYFFFYLKFIACMDSLFSPSSAVAAASGSQFTQAGSKRRCPVCGTKKMSTREDGRVMCKYGHEQAGVVEETMDDMVEGTTRRRTKKNKRISKNEAAQAMRLYGNRAQFLYLHTFQHILKTQATILVQEYGAPESLLGTVKNIWLLYVSKLKKIHMPDYIDSETVQKLQKRAQSMMTQEITQFSQTLSYDNIDDALDSLLKGVEDDIARDEQEMMEWEEGEQADSIHGDAQSTDSDESDDESDESEVGQEDEQEARVEDTGLTNKRSFEAHGFYRSHKRNRATDTANLNNNLKKALGGRTKESSVYFGKYRYGSNYAELEEWPPKLEYMPSIICLAFEWLRLPVIPADMFRLLSDARLPYSLAMTYVPEYLRLRVGKGMASSFYSSNTPSTRRLIKNVRCLDGFFAKHYSIETPAIDRPLLLLSLIKRLGLDIQIYPIVMRMLELTAFSETDVRTIGYRPEVLMIAFVIVALKLHYGFDEVERHTDPHNPGHEADLPPLGEFLAKWREQWEMELSVGIFPYLTSYGENWERLFMDHCRRAMAKNDHRDFKTPYKDISIRYSRMLEHLAVESAQDPHKANCLLPQKYLPATMQSQQQELASSTLPPTQKSDTHVCIEPIAFTTANGPAKTTEKRPIYTMLDPPTNYPESKLAHGELYQATPAPHSRFKLPGYITPPMGLILARCAMLVGCSQSVLNYIVNSVELKLFSVTDMNHRQED